MAESKISDEELVAWIDGELSGEDAARVVAAIEADPALAARAAAHRRLEQRMTRAFGPIADEPVSLPPREPAPVISLAAVRAARAGHQRKPRRWVVPGAIAASLLVGILVGHQGLGPTGVSDRNGALALAAPISHALDSQLSGEPGPIRVSLSFRGQGGQYCRRFTGAHLDGIACRDARGWQLRYAAPTPEAAQGSYRMAGSDSAMAAAIAGLIVGDPLDAKGEQQARGQGWLTKKSTR
jgi:hypothetical protein